MIFEPVFNSRKEKIRGLSRLGDRYYAQLRVEGPDGKKKPTRRALGAISLDEARAELEGLRTDNRRGELERAASDKASPVPSFAQFTLEYLASPIHGLKDESTRKGEGYALKRWQVQIGGVPLNKISGSMLQAYCENRLATGVKARTVNIELCAFHAVMKLARDRGVIAEFSRAEWLKTRPAPKRPLLRPENIERLLCACRPEVTRNAVLLRYYVRFLALSGAREKEALRVRWADIDLAGKFVIIGALPENVKNDEARFVNLSRELEELLIEIRENRQPDSSYLFPSAQRGEKDIPARSLRESFKLVRTAAGLPQVGFHDFRHFFASQCVMAGIDFKTIAAWLGHRDGGILVGKVYGHLSDDHKRRMAEGLSILKVPHNIVSGDFGTQAR
jgi:integrase